MLFGVSFGLLALVLFICMLSLQSLLLFEPGLCLHLFFACYCCASFFSFSVEVVSALRLGWSVGVSLLGSVVV